MKKAIIIAGGAVAVIVALGAGLYVLSRRIGARFEELYGEDEYGLGADSNGEDDSDEISGQLKLDI